MDQQGAGMEVPACGPAQARLCEKSLVSRAVGHGR